MTAQHQLWQHQRDLIELASAKALAKSSAGNGLRLAALWRVARINHSGLIDSIDIGGDVSRRIACASAAINQRESWPAAIWRNLAGEISSAMAISGGSHQSCRGYRRSAYGPASAVIGGAAKAGENRRGMAACGAVNQRQTRAASRTRGMGEWRRLRFGAAPRRPLVTRGACTRASLSAFIAWAYVACGGAVASRRRVAFMVGYLNARIARHNA